MLAKATHKGDSWEEKPPASGKRQAEQKESLKDTVSLKWRSRESGENDKKPLWTKRKVVSDSFAVNLDVIEQMLESEDSLSNDSGERVGDEGNMSKGSDLNVKVEVEKWQGGVSSEPRIVKSPRGQTNAAGQPGVWQRKQKNKTTSSPEDAVAMLRTALEAGGEGLEAHNLDYPLKSALLNPPIFHTVVKEFGREGKSASALKALELLWGLEEIRERLGEGDAGSSPPEKRPRRRRKRVMSAHHVAAVVDAVARAGDVPCAMRVLAAACTLGPTPNAAAYNSLMGALGRRGETGKAEELLVRMRLEAARKEKVRISRENKRRTLTGEDAAGAAIRLCSEFARGHGLEGAKVADFPKIGASRLDDFWGEKGFGGAGFKFPIPSVVSYTVVVGLYADAEDWRKAVGMLRTMEGDGVEANRVVYNKVMLACERCARWRECAAVLVEMWSAGIDPDEFSFAEVIAALGRAKEWEKALALMHLIRAQGSAPLSVRTYNVVLHACATSAQAQAAADVVDWMRADGLTPDAVTWSSLIGSFRKAGDWRQALRLYEEMLAAGVQPTAALWTEVMCAYAQGGLLQEALEAFWRMRERLGAGGLDIRVYNTALAVCGRDSDLAKEAVRIWDDINATRCEADETTMLLMITAMGKAGRLDYVQHLFQSIKPRGLPLKVEAFNAVMAAYAVARDFPGAASTFAEISKEGLHPTAVSYNTLLKACQRSGEGAHAAIVFERMLRAGFKPDGPSYTSLLSALESSGQAQLALQAFAQMKSSGVLAKGGPYVPFWYAKLIGACTAGNEHKAALQQGREMRSHRITPTHEALLFLLKAAEAVGEWREALALFEELKDVQWRTRGEDTTGLTDKCQMASTYASTRPSKKVSPEQPRRGAGGRAGVGVEAYNFVIGACSGGGEVRRAMELFEEMKTEGVVPTLGTYARVIRALQEAGDWERAMEVYNSIPLPMDRSLSSIDPRKKAI